MIVWIAIAAGLLWLLKGQGVLDAAAPIGSTLNPRVMWYTTFTLHLRPGTTEPEADRIILERGTNSAIRSKVYSPAGPTLTVTIANDQPTQADDQLIYFQSRPEVVSAVQGTPQPVNYYLAAGAWVSERDYAAFVADCPRQRALNSHLPWGECP